MRLFAAIVLVAGLLTAGCGSAGGDSILDKDTLVVGVRTDLPSLGYKRPDGKLEGFDIDVAHYIAAKLERRIRFLPVTADERISVLTKETGKTEKKADLVLGTLSVTPERKDKIAFAGPYYNSYQDIMVQPGDTGVTKVRDLKGRKFCSLQGVDPTARLLALKGMTVQLVRAENYDQCMEKFRAGDVAAISTNDVILAGLIKRESGRKPRLVNVKISEQNTGIGIRQGDLDGCEALNRAITQMYQDKTASKLASKWFGGTGLDTSIIEVPQFEGCD
ncbi:transporter substrate-binding domain-containing protein [Actinomadura xylanilytica]|uniref:transporter substrate-binding domain-containing protein n=1 Tax=Actinomadura xylanilytica TaxID=887459 RepID=UPI00255AC80E|nr:transporter substrate-binding domain-containing protein [Actinomadura xylanilytica]MDL4775611.1 transporter substrate-binding domain-containing protein [Actinomadura xylanilytica]